VISPEACSSILYRDPTRAEKAADALKLTAADLMEFGIIDEVVPEAPGGAHRDPKLTGERLGETLRRHLAELRKMSPDRLVDDRYAKFRAMGVFEEEGM
jgi:acetyl-CoA carboxylase carboxyl transferase subunit alpha